MNDPLKMVHYSTERERQMKIKLVMLLIAISLAMTACGGNTEVGGDNDGTVENRAEESSKERKEESSEEKETVSYTFGTYTDIGYENASLGYQFTAPEGCIVADENKIMRMAGFTWDMLGEDYSKAIIEYAKQAIVYDLYAAYSGTNNNVNVAVQQMNTSTLSMFYLLEVTRQQLEASTAMDITIEPGTIEATIAGKEYTGLKTITVVNGVTLTQELYMLIEEGRIVSITFTYVDEEAAEALKGAFSEL